MADVLRVRGDNRRAAGDLAGAAADLRRAAELAGRAGAPELVASARVGEAGVALDRGDVSLGRELAEEALAACPTGGFAGEATRSGILAVLGDQPVRAAAYRPGAGQASRGAGAVSRRCGVGQHRASPWRHESRR